MAPYCYIFTGILYQKKPKLQCMPDESRMQTLRECSSKVCLHCADHYVTPLSVVECKTMIIWLTIWDSSVLKFSDIILNELFIKEDKSLVYSLNI